MKIRIFWYLLAEFEIFQRPAIRTDEYWESGHHIRMLKQLQIYTTDFLHLQPLAQKIVQDIE
jgi:hypothetical protein